MRRLLHSLPISAKLAVIVLLSIAATAAAIVGLGASVIRAEMTRQAIERQEVNMRVAWAQLHDRGDAIRLVGGRLMAGDHVLNGDDVLVDEIQRLVGGTVTIFQGDRRIATNVPGRDGGRAVGTRLAPGPVHDSIFRDRRPYRGEADILGEAYLTAYDPILGPDGSVIGILYVGMPKAGFFTIMTTLVLNIGLLAGGAALLAAGLAFLAAVCIGLSTIAVGIGLDRVRAEGDVDAARVVARQEAHVAVADVARRVHVVGEEGRQHAQPVHLLQAQDVGARLGDGERGGLPLVVLERHRRRGLDVVAHPRVGEVEQRQRRPGLRPRLGAVRVARDQVLDVEGADPQPHGRETTPARRSAQPWRGGPSSSGPR